MKDKQFVMFRKLLSGLAIIILFLGLDVNAQSQLSVKLRETGQNIQGGAYAGDSNGNIYSAYFRNEKGLVVSKMNACGNVEWTKRMDVLQKENYHWLWDGDASLQLHSTPDGFVYAVTRQNLVSNDFNAKLKNNRIIIYCINSDGKLEWCKISSLLPTNITNFLASELVDFQNILFLSYSNRTLPDRTSTFNISLTKMNPIGFEMTTGFYFPRPAILYTAYMYNSTHELDVIWNSNAVLCRTVFNLKTLMFKSHEQLGDLGFKLFSGNFRIVKGDTSIIAIGYQPGNNQLGSLLKLSPKMDTIPRITSSGNDFRLRDRTVYTTGGQCFRMVQDGSFTYSLHLISKSMESEYGVETLSARRSGFDVSLCHWYDKIIIGDYGETYALAGNRRFEVYSPNLLGDCHDTTKFNWGTMTYDTIIVKKTPTPLSIGTPLRFKDTTMSISDAYVKHKILCVSGYQIPMVDLGNDTFLCTNDTLKLRCDDYYSPTARYLWSNGDTNFQTTITQSGYYWVQVSEGFCQRSDSIKVTFVPQETISPGSINGFCKEDSFALFLNMNLKTGLTWTFPDNTGVIIKPYFGDTIYTKIPGIYTAISKSPGKCPIHLSTQIVQSEVDADAGPDTTLCNGIAYQINASGTGIPKWIPNSQLSAEDVFQPVIMPTVSQSYVLQVADTLGCMAFDTVHFEVVDSLKLDAFAYNNPFCLGDTIVINARFSGGKPPFLVNYRNNSWAVKDSFILPSIIPMGKTTVNFNLKDGCGYQIINEITLTQSNKLIDSFFINPNDTVKINSKVTANLFSSESAVVQWWLDQSRITETGRQFTRLMTDSGVHVLGVLVKNGNCIDSAMKPFYVYETQWFIPNAFTPNDDQLNEEWRIACRYCDVVHLEIYNRWGQRIFRAENTAAWDGTTLQSKEVVGSGIYLYIATIREHGGGEHRMHGGIVVVR